MCLDGLRSFERQRASTFTISLSVRARFSRDPSLSSTGNNSARFLLYSSDKMARSGPIWLGAPLTAVMLIRPSVVQSLLI
jgi:hypothetical protein